jgi:hypothetical protein
MAAIALIIGSAVVAHKIRPEAARILHDVAEVLRLLLLTTGILVAVAITAWVTARLARWWLRHREAQRSLVDQGDRTRKYRLRAVRYEQRCLACGGNGQVLRTDGAGRFEPRACPECQPARLAG